MTSAPLDRRLIAAIAGAKLLIHLALSGRYGYFRDELYFLDCGRHLDWGYVDHAPLIGLVARLALLLGGSLPALRSIAAVAGALVVALAMALAWRLGAGRFGQAIAGLAVLAAPINLGVAGLMTMNVFEPLFWIGAVYAVVRLIDTGRPACFVAAGALAGAGLMNKHSTVFFLAALGAALLLGPERRWLATRWPWIGAAVALLLFAPNLAWQAAHGFPTLEDLQNVARQGKNVALGPLAFAGQQVLLQHPVLFPLWVAGLVHLFAGRGGRWRTLGWLFVVFAALMFALKAKNYYLAPIYPMLFAAGAVALEAGLHGWRRTTGRAWPKAAAVAVIVAAGAATAPTVVPILEPSRYVAYAEAVGFAPPKTERAHQGPLPQIFGDQFGWPELVAEVARIYHALPPQERARAAIFANNYGEAGAINLFGPALGLPTAISGHQTYFFWGPRGATGDVVIVLQGDRDDLSQIFTSVEEAGRHHHPWGMEEENRPIYVARGIRTPLAELWPRFKHWN